MKKKLLISIFVVMLLAAMSILPAFAASATANVASVSGNRGATVTVSVSLAKATTVGSGGIEVIYDTNVLELTGGTWNVSGTSLATFNPSNGKGAFAYASGTSVSGKVFTATFKIKSNAAFGASTVKMTLQLKDGSNADISVTNNAGKVTVTCKHSYSKWSSVNATSHTHTCSICNQSETKNHSFTNACDTSCNDCGYTRVTTHNWQSTWSSNGTKHWHECSSCKAKKDETSHVPGPAATETSPQKCTVCEYIMSGALEHVHTYSDTWSSNDAGHWKVCSSCGESDTAEAHTYDNSCDTSCNVCGKTRAISHTYKEEYESDGTSHWHVCVVCNEPSQKESHAYDNNCDDDCNSCGELRTVEHTFDNGSVAVAPTEGVAGKKVYTCTACGGTKDVELELVIEKTSTDLPPTVSNENCSPEDSDAQNESGGFSIVSMIIGVAVGAILGFGIAFVATKKKK